MKVRAGKAAAHRRSPRSYPRYALRFFWRGDSNFASLVPRKWSVQFGETRIDRTSYNQYLILRTECNPQKRSTLGGGKRGGTSNEEHLTLAISDRVSR